MVIWSNVFLYPLCFINSIPIIHLFKTPWIKKCHCHHVNHWCSTVILCSAFTDFMSWMNLPGQLRIIPTCDVICQVQSFFRRIEVHWRLEGCFSYTCTYNINLSHVAGHSIQSYLIHITCLPHYHSILQIIRCGSAGISTDVHWRSWKLMTVGMCSSVSPVLQRHLDDKSTFSTRNFHSGLFQGQLWVVHCLCHCHSIWWI